MKLPQSCDDSCHRQLSGILLDLMHWYFLFDLWDNHPWYDYRWDDHPRITHGMIYGIIIHVSPMADLWDDHPCISHGMIYGMIIHVSTMG